jgi:hypothetical protein
MKFYVIEATPGGVIGCELTLRAARAYAERRDYQRDEYEIDVVDCPINAETIRRLLGNLGGYAN